MNPNARAAIIAKAKAALAQLDPGERSALAGQRPLTFKRSISAEHERKLKELGLIERKLGGLALTPIGKVAAGMLPRW